MPRFRFLAALAVSALLLSHAHAAAQDRGTRSGRRHRLELNKTSPELYADSLRLEFVLDDLPGAAQPGSFWEGSYKLYFVAESDFWKAVSAAGGGSAVKDPSQFPVKTLLAEGTFAERHLRTTAGRTFVVQRVPFRARVPEKDRTQAANLLLSYSVKIYDARLKKTLYRSEMIPMLVFEYGTSDPERPVARTTLTTNFRVTPEGELR